MAEKSLRKLSRTELLELLVELGRENAALQERLEKAEKELESRRLQMEECGSIAEAALKLNDVFAAAQAAVDQYRENCERRCAEMIAEAEKQAADIRAAAEKAGKEDAE